ncbi:hypothetical protein RFI_03787, partial [Reticulomyxa filosa]
LVLVFIPFLSVLFNDNVNLAGQYETNKEEFQSINEFYVKSEIVFVCALGYCKHKAMQYLYQNKLNGDYQNNYFIFDKFIGLKKKNNVKNYKYDIKWSYSVFALKVWLKKKKKYYCYDKLVIINVINKFHFNLIYIFILSLIYSVLLLTCSFIPISIMQFHWLKDLN